ncbi:hypothetical protein AArcMg_1798 [Natrarchaeobaculum sulfurireducens]|uniref:Uncharacterized protein n=1 Tax=Natrarchaeobaculum sulfurireducens TaxID=2044521 RepID=A0A346PQL1_9EURY|nr:hypothetical protein AArcMg_1798 [Natrarchaeobaculum sulfurireducens]
MFAVHAADSGKVLKMKRMSAREVEQRLGGITWQHAGHAGKDSKQLKVPWPKLLSTR